MGCAVTTLSTGEVRIDLDNLPFRKLTLTERFQFPQLVLWVLAPIVLADSCVYGGFHDGKDVPENHRLLQRFIQPLKPTPIALSKAHPFLVHPAQNETLTLSLAAHTR